MGEGLSDGLTLFPWGVNLIRVTEGAVPGFLSNETGLGVPNSHITTEPSIEPVRSEWHTYTMLL